MAQQADQQDLARVTQQHAPATARRLNFERDEPDGLREPRHCRRHWQKQRRVEGFEQQRRGRAIKKRLGAKHPARRVIKRSQAVRLLVAEYRDRRRIQRLRARAAIELDVAGHHQMQVQTIGRLGGYGGGIRQITHMADLNARHQSGEERCEAVKTRCCWHNNVRSAIIYGQSVAHRTQYSKHRISRRSEKRC